MRLVVVAPMVASTKQRALSFLCISIILLNGGDAWMLQTAGRKRQGSSAVVVMVVSEGRSGGRELQGGGGGGGGSCCVAKATVDVAKLQTALDWACGSGPGLGNVDCSPIQRQGSCYTPNAIVNHASYAFDVYYSKQSGASVACNFNGLATITQTNPSSGTCIYPSSATTSSSTTTTPSSSSPSSPTLTGTSSNITNGPTSSMSPSGTPPISLSSLHWLQTFVCMLVVTLLSSSKSQRGSS